MQTTDEIKAQLDAAPAPIHTPPIPAGPGAPKIAEKDPPLPSQWKNISGDIKKLKADKNSTETVLYQRQVLAPTLAPAPTPVPATSHSPVPTPAPGPTPALPSTITTTNSPHPSPASASTSVVTTIGPGLGLDVKGRGETLAISPIGTPPQADPKEIPKKWAFTQIRLYRKKINSYNPKIKAWDESVDTPMHLELVFPDRSHLLGFCESV